LLALWEAACSQPSHRPPIMGTRARRDGRTCTWLPGWAAWLMATATVLAATC